ncbi:decapping endonuclease targeting mRNA [Xylographa vitiligo]|nr:decapping endonuclease targeting mRNA [Xylographa vitiligo]
MTSFDIQPLNRFAGISAAIRRPKEIAYFSYDDDHQYYLDERSLRYYYPPHLGADLSKGFDAFKQLDDTADDHLESLLKTIMALEGETGTKCEANIITWRGMMTKIMAVPFDNMGGNGFEMNATNFQRAKGTIFIEENREHKLEQRRYQHNQPSQPGAPSQDLMSYWGIFSIGTYSKTVLNGHIGYKFETLSLLPAPWHPTSREYIESRENEIVNNHAQYCSIVKTGIGKAKMILSGEVDAVWDSKPDNKNDPINWVELKTSAMIESDRDMLKYERKLLKFWIQSFLLGVPKIIVGFRSRMGILQRLEELETKSIPEMVKRSGKGSWDGNLCINFTAGFLDWLQQTITTEGVWRIRRRDRSSVIEVFRHEDSGYGDILSHEFIAWRKKGTSLRA